MSLLDKIKRLFTGEREPVYKKPPKAIDSGKDEYYNDTGWRCVIEMEYDKTLDKFTNDIEKIVLYPPEEEKKPIILLPNERSIAKQIMRGVPMKKLYDKYDPLKEHCDKYLTAQQKIDREQSKAFTLLELPNKDDPEVAKKIKESMERIKKLSAEIAKENSEIEKKTLNTYRPAILDKEREPANQKISSAYRGKKSPKGHFE